MPETTLMVPEAEIGGGVREEDALQATPGADRTAEVEARLKLKTASPGVPVTPPEREANPAEAAAKTADGDEGTNDSSTDDEESAVDYSSFKIGDSIDGVTIHHILLQYQDAIVFTSPAGHIHFRQDLGPRADVALVEFYRLTAKSSARLKQAFSRQVNGLLGAALAEALSLPENGDMRAPFRAIDEFIDANGPIKQVFGANDSWVVFVDTDGDVVCECPTVTDAIAPLLTEFYRLRELGKASLHAPEVVALNQILGTELAIALQRSTMDPADAFSASRDFICLKNDSRMRIRYVTASLVAAALFGLAAWAIVRDDPGLLLGCVGGVIGAAISVLQRSPDLEIRRFVPPGQVIMQGTVRITLGVLFGLLIVAAVRANLALGSLATSVNALFIAGVVAGFSERFVPDLLTKIGSDGGSAPATATAQGSKKTPAGASGADPTASPGTQQAAGQGSNGD